MTTKIRHPQDLLKRVRELETKLSRAETIDTRPARRALNSGDAAEIRAAVMRLVKDVEIVANVDYRTDVDWDRVRREMEEEQDEYERPWGICRRVPIGTPFQRRGECLTVDEFHEQLDDECRENGYDGFELYGDEYWIIKKFQPPEPGPYWDED